MNDFKVTLDVSSLTQFLDNFAKEVTNDIEKGVKGLANDTHNHIIEQVNQKLTNGHDREKYLKNLGQVVQIDKFMWMITLDENAWSIENGKKRDMKGEPGQWGLLKNPDGVVEGEGPHKGAHYKIIPLDQGRAPGEIDKTYSPEKVAYQKGIASQIKAEISKRGIPYRKLETESAVGRKTGQTINRPKEGRLHEFDVHTKSFPGTASTDVGARVNIYQTYNNKTNKVEKQITTFRTVFEGEDGKWQYPAPSASKFFEEAKTWAENQWQNEWLPKIMAKYKG
jgi:hypothetical protein